MAGLPSGCAVLSARLAVVVDCIEGRSPVGPNANDSDALIVRKRVAVQDLGDVSQLLGQFAALGGSEFTVLGQKRGCWRGRQERPRRRMRHLPV